MFKFLKSWNWKLAIFLLALGTIWIVLLRHPNSSNRMRRNVKKLNEFGQYLPFYGYTTLSMLEHPPDLGQNIEDFIRSSSLGRFFSPLPHETYHMTIFNIYAMQSKPIPPVERWVQNHSGVIPNNSWLPEEVLLQQNIQATNILSKYPPTAGIKEMSLYTPSEGEAQSAKTLRITLKDDFNKDMMKMRDQLKIIYEHGDTTFPGFHISLAYIYGEVQFNDKVKADMNTLSEMVKPLVKCRLVNPGVYLYDSMTNFIPFSQN